MKYFFGFLLLSSACTLAQPVAMEWKQVAAGVWRSAIGAPQSFDLLRSAGGSPMLEALQTLGERPFPLPQELCYAEKQNGKLYLRLPLQKEEELYGLGLNFKTVRQRGRVLTLHSDHYGGVDNGRTHAPTPFYVSDKGYGVLINSAQYITVYTGTGVRQDSPRPPVLYDRNTQPQWEAQPASDAVEILVPADGTEVYVYAGKTPMEAVQRFNLFSGGGVLPPKWGLGFTERVGTLSSAKDVRQETDSFAAHRFPLDFIGLEPGWQSRSYPCTFEWDKTRFPDPTGFIKEMMACGIRLNLWLNPYLSPASSLYNLMKPLSGSHTVWNGLVPDLNMPEAVKVYTHLFDSAHVIAGISGYKIDEIDGYDNWLWPDVAHFPSGISGEQMRQVFGLECEKFSADIFHAHNKRTYGLARASNAGGSALPYVLYDDYYDHRDFITALCNSSFIGVLWTPEVRASESADEWLRRFQSVCFSPMAMLNAWADGTKPWSYPEVEKQVRDVALLRMQLLPYNYTTFAQYYFLGIPPVRAMNLVEGFNADSMQKAGVLNSSANPYALAMKQDVKDEFLFGDNLLVAPLFAGEHSRKIVLPKGKWYDFYSGRQAGDGEIIEVTPDQDRIPLFVKDGGIIPMLPPVLHTPGKNEQLPLEIRCYGEKPGSFRLYDDDGETFDFEKGMYTWYEIQTVRNKKGNWEGTFKNGRTEAGSRPSAYAITSHYGPVTWKFMPVK
jgi:alpha-glucosidase (family GH31 glycosyl hydrolase)